MIQAERTWAKQGDHQHIPTAKGGALIPGCSLLSTQGSNWEGSSTATRAHRLKDTLVPGFA